jgi:hypothetical protein
MDWLHCVVWTALIDLVLATMVWLHCVVWTALIDLVLATSL